MCTHHLVILIFFISEVRYKLVDQNKETLIGPLSFLLCLSTSPQEEEIFKNALGYGCGKYVILGYNAYTGITSTMLKVAISKSGGIDELYNVNQGAITIETEKAVSEFTEDTPPFFLKEVLVDENGKNFFSLLHEAGDDNCLIIKFSSSEGNTHYQLSCNFNTFFLIYIFRTPFEVC